jgi:hydrogenase maturation protease
VTTPGGADGRRVVVGVGAPDRRDDGSGPRVVAALRGRVPPDVELVGNVPDATALVDLWDGAALAVVVDAMRSGAAPGTVARRSGDEVDALPVDRPTSSHGLSVADAVGLGRALGRMPSQLVLYLIEARDVAPGSTLTAEVAAAVDRTAERIVAELRARAS